MDQAARTDDFFSSLDNTKPFLKVAFEGFAGSGKTRTAAELAVGVHRRIGSTKPIVCFDTEKAAVFLRKFFAERGIQVLHKESRTLADLKEAMRRCRDGAADIILIDSISHVWENFLQSYQKQHNRRRLQFEDWGVLKPKWKEEFSEPFVRDRYHAIMCGRAGYEYSDEKVEGEDGKVRREIHKTGIKMKVEGETAYEPDVLVMMERFEAVLERDKEVWREATILKDRSALIDGKTFKNPTYADFAPAVEYLLDGVVERETPAEAENTFESDDSRQYARRRDIALENIEAEMTMAGLVGNSADAKRGKVTALSAAFGTASWTQIKGLHPDKLEAGIETLRDHLRQRATATTSAGDGGAAAGDQATGEAA